MLRIRRNERRRGMTIVESTLVLGVFCLLLFGAFEYCRFLYTLHLTHNAARDGARYAVVNVDKPASFSTTNYNGFTNITQYTTDRMSGAQKQLSGYRVAVFSVDPLGQSQSPPIIRPKSSSTATPKVYPDPFTPSANTVPWNQATFTESIAVTIDGTYIPLLPNFLSMQSSMRITVTSVACSEG